MPQVPYSPIPDVAPSNIPTPRLSGATPPAAFGVGIAESIERLGGTTQKVGDELFDRAYAMQQLRNETEKSDAVNEVEKRNSLSWEKYKSLEGRNAVDAFPKYQEELTKNRDDVKAGLSNPMVQKMFDGQANSITNRLMTYGAGHAAQQNKVAADGAAKATIDGLNDRILQNPDDRRGYIDGLNDIEQAVRSQANLRGWDATQTEQEVAKARSAAMRNLIEGTNRTDPEKAKAMLDASRYSMHATDIQHLEPKIQQQNRIVGSRNISDAVNKGWAPYMSPAQIDKMSGVQEPLTRILQQAQRDNPNLRILPESGYRSVEEQAEIRARHEAMSGGVYAHPAAKPGESYHNYGRAVDLVPGAGTTYDQIEVAMKAASAKLGIPFSPEHDRLGARDPGHYSIPMDYDVGSAPPAKPEPEESRLARAMDYAKQKAPDDPLFADVTRERTQTDYAHQERVRINTERDNTQTLIDRIMDRRDGQPARSIDELLADPEARKAYDQLPPKVQASIPAKINTYNRSLEQQTDQDYLTQLRGMKETDRDAFLRVNPLDPKLPLSQPARRQVIAWQNEKHKDPETSPRIHQALTILAPTMQAQGITKKDDEDKYYEFIGAMDDALAFETERTGKRPGFEDIKKIGDRLLYTTQASGWFSRKYQVFNDAERMSGNDLDAIRAEMLKKNPAADITDRDVIREVARQRYQEISKTEAKNARPSVPR